MNNQDEFFVRLQKRFKNLYRTTVPFPTDEEVTRLMKARRKETIDAIDDDDARRHFTKNTKIGALRLPEAFRTGVFGHYFMFGSQSSDIKYIEEWDPTKGDRIDEYMITCFFAPWIHAEDDDYRASEDDDLTNPPVGKHDEDSRCKQCHRPAVYEQVDHFFGFGRGLNGSHDLCEPCHDQRYRGTNLLPTLGELTRTRNVNKLIHEYTVPAPTLRKIELGVEDVELVTTSHIYEWVTFMFQEQEDTSSWWLVNCNPQSKFYGHVLRTGFQDELYLLGTIEEFSDPDVFIREMNNSVSGDDSYDAPEPEPEP